MNLPIQKHECQEIGGIFAVFGYTKIRLPLMTFKVAAGFPSPAEDYIEGRIDLNQELIKHPSATFCVRVTGDSMEPEICPGEILVVDRAVETKSGDIVVARLGDEMCVKELHLSDTGAMTLISANKCYQPILIGEDTDFEVWGKVLWSIKAH